MLNTSQPGAAPGTPPTRPSVQTLPIRFTGSGSEYFRIWIVNLLLILVTFTLYLPFARARRIAYFQNNTLVGDDPVGFHADPWKMFRGYLVVAAFGLSYAVASELAPQVGIAIFLVFALAWPALWRSSLQFRLRNSSWRGVRLAFDGDLKGAYLAFAPLLLPVLGLVAMVVVAFGLAPGADAPPRERHQAGIVMAVLTGIVMITAAAVLPWCVARIKRYQHGGYRFAGERTELRAGTGAFYGVGFRAAGVMLLVTILGGFLVGLIAFALGQPGLRAWAPVAGYLLVPLVVVPYFTARLQNLVWANTRSRNARFRSDLGYGALLRINLVNWLLIVLTLGLYWPFAEVRLARVRLEAMALQVKGSVDDWLARAQRRKAGVLGDAAGDFLGIDMGL